MDLSSIPVIDSHAHPFDPLREEEDFRVYFNMSLWTPSLDIVKNTVLNRKLMRELGKSLGAPLGANQDEIAEYRNELYRANPRSYIQKLFTSVNLETILADTGFPHEQFTGYSVDLKQFAELLPCKVYPIFRMDTSVYKIFSNLPKTFEEAVDIVNRDLDRAVEVDKVVAVKSILAYETGLAPLQSTPL